MNSTVTVNFNVGISSQNFAQSIIAFPNPASEKIYFSGLTGISQIIIFDVTGRMIENSLLKKNNSFVNVSNYENGIYFYQLTDVRGGFLNKGKFAVVK